MGDATPIKPIPENLEWERTFNTLPHMIALLDTNYRIIRVNKAMADYLNMSPEKCIGQFCYSLMHEMNEAPGVCPYKDLLKDQSTHSVEINENKLGANFLITVSPLFFEDGVLAGSVHIAQDISERKETEEALRDREVKYRQILENIDDGYFEVDLAGHFVFFNDVLPRFLGYTHEELLNANFKKAMNEENVRKVFDVFHEVFMTDVPARLVDFEIKRKDGTNAFVESSVFLLKDSEGKTVGFCGLVRDITERKLFQDRLHAMAVTDQLTGLYNRRGFITIAEQQLKSADRSKRKGLLAFIDLDGMKRINDNWGHVEGDRALVLTAKLLKQAFRESDIIARIGGDEFAVLSSDVSDMMQDVFLARLKQQIDAYNIQGDLFYTLSMSFGCAFYDPENPCSLDELMSRADTLMYENKRKKIF